MSWPSTDREVEIEYELQALRRVAQAAREVVRDGWNGNSARHAEVFMKLGDALAALPEEEST